MQSSRQKHRDRNITLTQAETGSQLVSVLLYGPLQFILPLLKPSLVTTVIIQFYWKWDDYMGPLLYLSKPQSYTVSIAIKLFADLSSTTDYGAMFAMSTLSLIPVFLIFLIFNRYLVQGIGTSGLKG